MKINDIENREQGENVKESREEASKEEVGSRATEGGVESRKASKSRGEGERKEGLARAEEERLEETVSDVEIIDIVKIVKSQN